MSPADDHRIRLSKELWARLDTVATQNNTSVTSFVTNLVESALATGGMVSFNQTYAWEPLITSTTAHPTFQAFHTGSTFIPKEENEE